MNGMVPYVDFSDSKGPLLWLIYGLGYVLNHHSYVGVFWMSVPFYTATLFFAYKLCRLYTGKQASVLAVTALPFFLFFYKLHCEVRAEDFNSTFVMLALYCMCQVLHRDNLSTKTYSQCSAGVGLAIGCCLLIKWNCAVMLLAIAAVVAWEGLRRHIFLHGLKGFVIGFLVIVIPFAVYLAAYGALDNCIREYIANTFSAVNNVEQTNGAPLHFSIWKIVRKFFILILLGNIFFCWRYKTGPWIPICYIVFLLLAACGEFAIYFAVALPFALFLILPVADYVTDKARRIPWLTTVLCTLAAIVVICFNIRGINAAHKNAERDRAKYYRGAYVMSQISRPKLMFCDFEGGIGTPCGGLPACRYYGFLYRGSEEMKEQRHQALREGKPDFIIWAGEGFSGITKAEIERCGYVFYCYAIDSGLYKEVSIFGRPGLRMPPSDFHVTQWDVWLKRDIFGVSRR